MQIRKFCQVKFLKLRSYVGWNLMQLLKPLKWVSLLCCNYFFPSYHTVVFLNYPVIKLHFLFLIWATLCFHYIPPLKRQTTISAMQWSLTHFLKRIGSIIVLFWSGLLNKVLDTFPGMWFLGLVYQFQYSIFLIVLFFWKA